MSVLCIHICTVVLKSQQTWFVRTFWKVVSVSWNLHVFTYCFMLGIMCGKRFFLLVPGFEVLLSIALFPFTVLCSDSAQHMSADSGTSMFCYVIWRVGLLCSLCLSQLAFLISQYCYMWKDTLKSYKNVIHVSVSEYSFYCYIQCFEIFFICNKGCFLMCVLPFPWTHSQVCYSSSCSHLSTIVCSSPVLRLYLMLPAMFLPSSSTFCLSIKDILFLHLLCCSCGIFMYLHIPNACMLHAVQTSWTWEARITLQITSCSFWSTIWNHEHLLMFPSGWIIFWQGVHFSVSFHIWLSSLLNCFHFCYVCFPSLGLPI
jgi:hypothetical protein